MNRFLLTLVILLLPCLAQAQLQPRSFMVPIPGTPIIWDDLPGSPRAGDAYAVNDMNATCDGGGSTNRVIVIYSGTAWECYGGLGTGVGGAQTLTSVLGLGRVDTTLNSEANALDLGDGTRSVKYWCDATDGCIRKPNPLGDSTLAIWPGKLLKFRDMNGLANMLVMNPAAASRNAMYEFSTNYKPVISIPVALSPRGAVSMNEESIVTNQEKTWWGILTDVDTDAFDFSFPITARMVGATTATVRLIGVSKNAAPAGNIQLHCALKAYRPGTDTYTAHDVTGEVAVTLTPATQNRAVGATTTNITINGTIADGGEMYGSCEVSSAGTTATAPMLVDFRLKGTALVQLHGNSISD